QGAGPSLESARGAGDLITVWARRGLALVLAEQQRGTEAEALFQKSVKELGAAFGENHVAVADALGTLAAFYMNHGRVAGAEPLLRRVVAIREKSQAIPDPGLGTALQTLAELTEQQGDLTESIELYQKALAAFEKVFGPEHPLLIGILEKYAAVLKKGDRKTEADAALQRAIQ